MAEGVAEGGAEGEAEVDVAVVGGGPAGAAAALWLATAGHSVALYEVSGYDRPRVGESLAPRVTPLLAELDLTVEGVSASALPSYGTRSRWGTTDTDSLSHVFGPYQHGWHVDRQEFDAGLAAAAADRGVSVWTRCRVGEVRWDGSRWRLGLQTSTGRRAVQARVLLDATGRRSALARSLGARRLVFDRLVAVSRTVHGTAHDFGAHVLVEVASVGWWYSAPLPGDRLIMMLMTDADVCRSTGLAGTDAWSRALGRTGPSAARWSLGEPDGAAVRVHPATTTRHLRQLRTDRRPWLGVGDAALSPDPLSGTGVALALEGAARAATAVRQLLAAADGTGAVHAYEVETDRRCTDHLQGRRSMYAAAGLVAGPFWSRRSV